MNRFEKKSYVSFLLLYLVSTFGLMTLAAFWYYTGQKETQGNLFHYKMLHIADETSSRVIHAHMSGTPFRMLPAEKGYSIALLDADRNLLYGSLPQAMVPIEAGIYDRGPYNIMITTGTNDHLGVRYVVVATTQLSRQLRSLRDAVIACYLAALLIATAIGALLSRLFLKPIRKKMETVERFIKDVTHELNTPISALRMSTQRALQKGRYDEHTLRNISASTKQLYDIYSALSYINFNRRETPPGRIDLADSLKKSVTYFDELTSSKSLRFVIESEPTPLQIDAQLATMMINNLFSNAIKYSPVGSSITVLLKDRVLMIQDRGIGIAQEDLSHIFDRFSRATEYAGGFGLGLSIVKAICDEHGIEIKITSEVGHGTTMMLLFPDEAV